MVSLFTKYFFQDKFEFAILQEIRSSWKNKESTYKEIFHKSTNDYELNLSIVVFGGSHWVEK